MYLQQKEVTELLPQEVLVGNSRDSAPRGGRKGLIDKTRSRPEDLEFSAYQQANEIRSFTFVFQTQKAAQRTLNFSGLFGFFGREPTGASPGGSIPCVFSHLYSHRPPVPCAPWEEVWGHLLETDSSSREGMAHPELSSVGL